MIFTEHLLYYSPFSQHLALCSCSHGPLNRCCTCTIQVLLLQIWHALSTTTPALHLLQSPRAGLKAVENVQLHHSFKTTALYLLVVLAVEGEQKKHKMDHLWSTLDELRAGRCYSVSVLQSHVLRGFAFTAFRCNERNFQKENTGTISAITPLRICSSCRAASLRGGLLSSAGKLASYERGFLITPILINSQLLVFTPLSSAFLEWGKTGFVFFLQFSLILSA